ncbi:alpha-amylase [Myxococcota bacterium]|nr:alpha-amylase [Myxococcota bacterium]
MKRLAGSLLLTSLAGALAACGGGDGGKVEPPPPPVDTRKLHVPSPDWSQQIIYFVLTDRFSNGSTRNDDQGKGEYDPADLRKYSGGDLKGIQDRLGYIQELGATAVWITPPVANMWWDPRVEFGGYHGYWARDLKSVDEHLGTLEDYKNLSHALHDRGMYLVQDIVPNHMGNFFAYDGAYDPADPTKNWVANEAAVPTSKPVAPFDQNDPTDPAHVAANIYHFTPPIADYNDPEQEERYQLSDLDDLATENPEVRALLRDAYGYWVKEVGVDGFRIDTAKFIEPGFWGAFLHEPTTGIHAVAAATGRHDFLAFGEIFESSTPTGVEAELKIREHLGTTASPGLDAALAFPLYSTLGQVLGEGRPTEELAFRLEKFMDASLAGDPYRTPTFIDNHDVARFVDGAGDAGLRQALELVMTIPGVPVIYQGTEQAFTEPRASMFAAGWGSGGEDHFDTESEPFDYLRGLITLRKSSAVFTKGELVVRQSSPAGPGVLAYERKLGDERAIVVLNTSAANVLVADLDADLEPGQPLVEWGPSSAPFTRADANGKVLFELGPRETVVLVAQPATEPVTPAGTLTLDAPPPASVTAPWRFSGTVTGTDEVLVVVDDDLDHAVPLTAIDGTFTATLALDAFEYGTSRHTLTLYAKAIGVSTPRYALTVMRTFDGVRVSFEDPADDDHGPSGTYTYPADATFGSQMDMLGVTVEAGATLSLVLDMAEISTSWRPRNGFDHVCFSLFFELPGQTEATNVLPLLSGTTPEGFTWSRNHFAAGWSNYLRSANGATAEQDGRAVAGAPTITADAEAKTIRFTYDKTPFGLDDWTGVRVYITTWDFDGIDNRFRPLTPEGGQWVMGGGAETDPKIMDAIGPITIPPRT